MKVYNIKVKNQIINFTQAIKKGLGLKKGLFFPEKIPKFKINEIENILTQNFVDRSVKILNSFFYKDIKEDALHNIVKKSFSFTVNTKLLSEKISVLELFHGPTLAFKDFGSQFMAQILSYLKKIKEKFLILTATSGDTGAAVAHAFYDINDINVVILYPYGKISKLQEKLFCTLGKNITTIAIDGDFDDCQSMVKQSFEDNDIKNNININSANSINISRLLAQICYYFEAISQIYKKKYFNNKNIVFSVPSGNFGNLTAGLIAKSMGLPIKRFIAATNINDTIPRFLSNGVWNPNKTIQTISSAMDISKPNNWPRIEEIFTNNKEWLLKNILSSFSLDDHITKLSIKELYKKYSYIADPHSAIAYKVLSNNIDVKNEFGVFLSTAHPAKFKEIVEKVLNKKIDIPITLSKYKKLKTLSLRMNPNFNDLKKFLISKFK